MGLIDLKYYCSSSVLKDLQESIEIPIYAHDEEELNVHLKKTEFCFILMKNDNVLINFFNFFNKQYNNLNPDLFFDFVQKMIYFHDLGKISFKFQIEKVGNDLLKSQLEDWEDEGILKYLDDAHSLVGSLLLLSYFFEKDYFNSNDYLLFFSYVIFGHHTSLKDIDFESDFAYSMNDNSKFTYVVLSNYLGISNFKTTIFQKVQNGLYVKLEELVNENPKLSQFSFFYNYIYSLLIKSDFIASSYSNKNFNSIEDYFKNINLYADLIDSINQNFYLKDFNKSLDGLLYENLNFNDLYSENKNDLNSLRRLMLIESSTKFQYSLEKTDAHVFFLQIPTGGGKTNTSIKLALDVINNKNLNKIIYAMPFINIINQNYDVIKDTLGLDENSGQIRKIYSGTESIFEDFEDYEKSEILMKDDFFDYPIICTTFVTLFNIIIKNKKKNKYALSSLANSVIILDEIQSLPLDNWTSLYYLINEMSMEYNIYFIIMSATLPDFKNLKINNNIKLDYEVINLIEKPEKYFNNELFKRTRICSFDTIDLDEDDFCNYFTNIFTKNFEMGFNKGLLVFNTVRTSKIVFKELKKYFEYNDFDVEMDLLNSTILPSQKEKIIHKIKNMDILNKNYLLISTQSIEAGVDVSFDFVIRDFATIDSIEQVRGRCNRSREINKKFQDDLLKGNCYLIDIKRKNSRGQIISDYERIYGKDDLRIKEAKKIIIEDKNLNYEYFDICKYYENVTERINESEEDDYNRFVRNDAENIKRWNRCLYSQIQGNDSGIHIIQNNFETYSFFVSTDLEILKNNEISLSESIDSVSYENLHNFLINEKVSDSDLIFSINEIKYLKREGTKYGFEPIINNKVSGKIVLDLYKKMIHGGSYKKKIINKEFSSIFYKFIFQSAINNFDENEFNHLSFFYILNDVAPRNAINFEDYTYSLEYGFNAEKLNRNYEIL